MIILDIKVGDRVLVPLLGERVIEAIQKSGPERWRVRFVGDILPWHYHVGDWRILFEKAENASV